MLKFFVAYPFERKDIVDAGTSVSANKVVKSMESNLNNMLEKDISRFGFDMKKKTLSKESSGPGIANTPQS